MAPLLDPNQREAEVDDRVADDVVGAFVSEGDEDRPAVGDRLEALGGQPGRERRAPLLHLDGERPGLLGERHEGRGSEEPAALDGDEEVADAFDLTEQVRGHDGRDAEFGAGAVNELQHLVPARGIEPVRRLVKEQQTRIVDERLGELDPLLHARGVAAYRPVALLVQPDVPEDLGRSLARSRPRQAGHEGEMRDEIGRRCVGRQAIVLGKVADELADVGPASPDVHVEDGRLARGRVDEPEEDLEERALAGAVRSDQPDDAAFDLDGQAVERGDAARIALCERTDRNQSHVRRVPERNCAAATVGQPQRSAASSATRASVPSSRCLTMIAVAIDSAVLGRERTGGDPCAGYDDGSGRHGQRLVDGPIEDLVPRQVVHPRRPRQGDAGTDDRAASDEHPLEEDAAGPDEGPIFDDHRPRARRLEDATDQDAGGEVNV